MKFLSPLWNTFTNDKLLQKIVKNTGYLLSSNVASMGLSMMQSILAGRLLGVAGFGVIATITAFASMLNRLFSFRMNELVVKYFGEACPAAETRTRRGGCQSCFVGRSDQRGIVFYRDHLSRAACGFKTGG